MSASSRPTLGFINKDGEQINPFPSWLSDEKLLRFYCNMALVRSYDKKAIALQRTGQLGTYPSHYGAEAIGIATGMAMASEDVYIPYYRDMPCLFMRGVPMEKNLQYWGGDERGSVFNNGKGQVSQDFPYCVPIATQCGHAVGVASAFKIRGEKRVAVVTCGDGATSKGDFLEALNCAGVWQLPLVTVINNNQWAISVPRSIQCGADYLVDKAIGAGIHGELVDGNDVVAMYDAVSRALEKARAGKGSTLIEAVSYRLGDHTTADDASRYRPVDELTDAIARDPLYRLKIYLLSQRLWSEQKQQELDKDCQQQVASAVSNYQSLTPEAPETMFDHLYCELPPELENQREALIERALNRERDNG